MTRIKPAGVLLGPSGPVAHNVRWATSFRDRRRGVIGWPPLGPDDALVIVRCRRVHTFGVGYRLDAIFCDVDLRVLHVESLDDGRISARVPGARSCIELAGGRAEVCEIVPGVQLSFGEGA